MMMCPWLWLAGWLFQKMVTYISSFAWPWFFLVALGGVTPTESMPRKEGCIPGSYQRGIDLERWKA